SFSRKRPPLAPIGAEILLCRGSAQKIEAHSGIKLLKKIKTIMLKLQSALYLLYMQQKNKPERF
ncbi:hypothetical protein ACFFLS_04125, partial [Flavobacterium procerum]